MKAFECKMCGECCWGEGISLSDEEIRRISKFLKIAEEEFKRRYCKRKRERYELLTKPSGYCIFLREDGNRKMCMIHPVKPDLCKKWPFFNSIISDEDEWNMAKSACPGIDPDAKFEEFVRQAISERNN